MQRQKEVENIDDNELDENGQNNVNVSAVYAGNRQEDLDTLAKIQENFDGRLRCSDMDRHRSEPSALSVRPINSDHIPHWTESMRIQEGRNGQNALHKGYGASRFRVGISDITCPEKGWLTRTLCLLQKAGRCDLQGPLRNFANERLFGLPMRSAHILDFKRFS